MARPASPARRPAADRAAGSLTALLGLLALGCLAAGVVRLFDLDSNVQLVAVLAVTPYVAAGSLLLGVLCLLLRRWAISMVVLALAVLLAATVVPRLLHQARPYQQGQQVRVLSANLYYGRTSAEAVVNLVREHQVDVLSLQELTQEAVDALDRAGLAEALPHRVFQASGDASGSGLAARYPLTALPPAAPSTFAQPAARVDLPGAADFDVVAVHVAPPHLGDAADPWRRELAGLPERSLAAPVQVLAGDFNATVDHAAFRRLLAVGYADAAAQTGAALTPTWPDRDTWWPPAVTIDHILVDDRISVDTFDVFDLPGSDHRAVFSQFVVPDR